ncbi:MAG: response regulator [Acidobacteria bacterium]|nr:response regulator [Acidobacteriota bacterium]
MGKRLLVADDSVTIQKVVNLTFAEENLEIDAAPDGDQALEKAKQSRPDLVLADISMPGLNGYQLCERIKTDPQLNGTPVLLLVGSFETLDQAEAERVRCDGHLTKPFETAHLVRTVHSLIGRSSRRPAVPAGPGDGREAGKLVSPRTMESFLGSERILDLFDEVHAGGSPAPAADAACGEAASERPAPAKVPPKAKGNSGGAKHVIPFPGVRLQSADLGPAWLSEDLVDTIVERVVLRMSPDIVREVAWEVVPEMSEMIIREILKKQHNLD